MMKRVLAALVVSVFVVVPCKAQEKTILKNEDIVRITRSKVSDAVIQVMIGAVPVALPPAKSAVEPGRIIKEGVGWREFTVGANPPALEQALGLPDFPSQSPILAWQKLGINCLLDNRGEAMELRFNKEFRGVTEAGIGWGMRQKTAKQAYGEPELTLKKSGGEKWEWKSKGILIWFNRGRVSQIVIFRPR